MAGYALEAGSRRQTILPGDGLVGQVAVDGKRILVKDNPSRRMGGQLRTGGIKPRTIIASPSSTGTK